ncbi:MAG TPA: alpha/beta hydrolase [Candidatus Paceibacterota bacterium]|nr:alpha/beta hydrolase [Candidatus Paceibacterota bacterium]
MKVIVDNLAVEYMDEGQGPVVLMLHGWMNSLHSFDSISKLLSTKYRVVRLDLPGFGASETPKSSWHVADYVTFVTHFLAKTAVEPHVLLGHSLGGRIILKGLAEHTLSAQKAVLIASAGAAERNTLRNWSFKMIAKAGRAATAVPPFTLLRAKLRNKLYSAAGSDYAQAGSMAPTFLNIIAENLAPLAPQVNVPTLLVWGSADTTTPLSEGKRLQALLPDAKLEVIQGAGHFVQEEKAADVARMIEEFI